MRPDNPIYVDRELDRNRGTDVGTVTIADLEKLDGFALQLALPECHSCNLEVTIGPISCPSSRPRRQHLAEHAMIRCSRTCLPWSMFRTCLGDLAFMRNPLMRILRPILPLRVSSTLDTAICNTPMSYDRRHAAPLYPPHSGDLLLRAHPRRHLPQLAIRPDHPHGIHLLDNRLIRDIVDHEVPYGEQGVLSYNCRQMSA